MCASAALTGSTTCTSNSSVSVGQLSELAVALRGGIELACPTSKGKFHVPVFPGLLAVELVRTAAPTRLSHWLTYSMITRAVPCWLIYIAFLICALLPVTAA